MKLSHLIEKVRSEPSGFAAQPRAEDSFAWYAVIAIAYLLGLTVLGTALHGNVGFPLDDSWIHQVIARNLVQFHTWGFRPGVSSSGSSSTLWTLVLAVHYLLFSHVSPVYFPLVLNALLLTGTGLLLWRMAVLDRLSRNVAIALAVLPALSGNLVCLAFIGMEHVLFLFLSTLAILLWFQRPASTRSAVLAGLVLGALGMTRPKGWRSAFYCWCAFGGAAAPWPTRFVPASSPYCFSSRRSC